MLISSDSSSALASLKHTPSRCRQDILYEILKSLYRIIRFGNDVQILWVAAHIGVQGNETVDHLASKAENKAFIWSKIKMQ